MLFAKCQRNFLSYQSKSSLVANLWGYVAIAFNEVDTERLKLVGSERLCAEWILKNGGAVMFTAAAGKYLRNYNALPPENCRLTIKEIDASNSSIMKMGFDHFKNCNHIDTIILHNCKHLESDGLEDLVHLKNTLHHLQVSGCHNISDQGLLAVKILSNLKYLEIFDMPYVRNLEGVVKEIKTTLPNCEVQTK